MPEERDCRTPGCCSGGYTRRDFIRLAVSAGAGFSLFGLPGFAVASPDHKLSEQELERWLEAVMGPANPLTYSPRNNPLAAVPFGGIGCGNVYVGVDGALKDWLIFNNVQPVQIPNTFFAIRCAGPSGRNVTRALQTQQIQGVEKLLLVEDIKLTGEYPQALLEYLDADLPVSVKLKAATPFVPLNSRGSAISGVRFDFTVRNSSPDTQKVSMLFAAQNSAGLGSFGGNVNTVRSEGSLTSIVMAIRPGIEPSIDEPTRILSTARNFTPTTEEMPEELTVTAATPGLLKAPFKKEGSSARTIYWLEEPSLYEAGALRHIEAAASSGAHIVFSGAVSLLNAAAGASELSVERPDIVIDDFEDGAFHKWQVTGDAFAAGPQTGTLPFQQPVSGYEGKYFVNSFNNGDGTTGRMISRPFEIQRRAISFLIGGGAYPGQTCLNLVVHDRIVRTQTGKNSESLERVSWDVSGLQGQKAHLEIVDQHSGSWGHVNVDDIRQTDESTAKLTKEAASLLGQLLPVGLAVLSEQTGPVSADVKLDGVTASLTLPQVYGSPDMTLSNGAQVIARSEDGSPLIVSHRYKNGSATLVLGPLWMQNDQTSETRQQALSFLVAVAEGHYTPGKGIQKRDPAYGEMSISTDAPSSTALPFFQSADQLLALFSARGSLPSGRDGEETTPSAPSETANAALSVSSEIPPGQENTFSFYLTWRFPNYWFQNRWIGNRYARFWSDSFQVARTLANDAALARQTESYLKSMYQTSLPYWLIDCLSSQSSTIRSEVCVWTDQDAFAGYEGSGGCCPMNCTHVWGYEQTLARLFPDLERRMRNADFKHQQNADGGINNRISLPVVDHPTGERPFVDGHASSILKAYREHLNSPDASFLNQYWPNIRKAVDYLVHLDGDSPDGIIEGEQWNTYDCQVSGPNSFIGSYYLAALRAGEEMAKEMGDHQAAGRWRSIFESGQKRLVELCWNGEYFVQKLQNYQDFPTQYGPGCLSDQLIGQWWAHQLGLGYVLPQKLVRTALRSIYKYNWRSDFSDFKHAQRVFADGHDKGLLNCSWPHGGRPERPILYCDEVWTGVEYQVAAHMIYEGMLQEGMAIVAGARERYDGARRNPWNEIECGGHYARAMSNWSILLALSGFHYRGPQAQLEFAPKMHAEAFKSFFSVSQGWGSFAQRRQGDLQTSNVHLAHGELRLKTLLVTIPEGARLLSGEATVSGRKVGKIFTRGPKAVVTFSPEITLTAGQTLSLRLRLSR
ncbi:MAG: hypothetical protein IT209_04175 [Armatimonadetes bacterium]|nr:hypothetical protein [Armatimonadota bacterium]